MTHIFPFIGTRYNSRLIEDMKMVISPSYETLTPEEKRKYCEQHPHNIMHLIPPNREEDEGDINNSFLRVASTIQAWRRDGILVNDNHKSFYLYEQKYANPQGKQKERIGLYAMTSLKKQREKEFKVEGTKPFSTKSYHLNLLRATNCNFAPVIMFFHDQENDFKKFARKITVTKPWEEFQDIKGNIHRLWVLNKKDLITSLTEIFKKKDCFLIEGHDRYEIAMKYSGEQREITGKTNHMQPFDYTMIFLSSFEEESVTTKPIHRVLSSELGSGIDIQEILDDLNENFMIKQIRINIKKNEKAAEKILQTIASKKKKQPTIGMGLPDGRAFALTLKKSSKLADIYDEETELSDASKKINVNILYHHIIRQVWIGNPEVELEEEDILYFNDAERALKQLIERKASAAFFLNPCPMNELNDVVVEGDTIPPFTVRLFPSLISGLVIRDISVRH